MSAEDNAPSREEKEEQLKRILTSATFAKYRMSRALLERLVRDSLSGDIGNNYESRLAIDVFNKPANWHPLQGTVVRQGMRNLRKLLETYYGSEGANDRIGVAFPPFSGFAPRFSCRRGNDADNSLRRLTGAFYRAFPDVSKYDIINELQHHIKIHPLHAPSYAALAETLLACLMCDEIEYLPLPKTLAWADELVSKGLKLNRDIWRLHLLDGAIHCCRFAWDKAEAAFGAALRLAPEKTRGHTWYAAFLLAVGRREEAKQCLSERLKQPRTRLTIYSEPLFLYVMRDFRKAYEDLLRLSPLSTNTALLGGETVLMNGHNVVWFIDWPAEILLACLCLALNYHTAAVDCAYAGVVHSGYVEAFSGLSELAYREALRRDRSGAACAVKNGDLQSPLSLALGYMGKEEFGEAIEQLAEACNIGHPLMVWLHLWPVFDPLREDARFKALIRKINFPGV
jgi:tetratricopeptide (TPR) repeat protein